jgi:hypothetical protein
MNETPPPTPVTFHVKTSALAIWSLVLGIVGLVLSIVCIGIVIAIPGVICGHMALSRIKNSSGLLTGNGLAIGGLVTGYLGIAMLVLLIPIAIPNFVKARQTAQANMCINNLRQIDSAKNQWALEHGKKSGDVPTADDLTPYFKNHVFPICPAGGVYTIGPVGADPKCSVEGHVLPQISQ